MTNKASGRQKYSIREFQEAAQLDINRRIALDTAVCMSHVLQQWPFQNYSRSNACEYQIPKMAVEWDSLTVSSEPVAPGYGLATESGDDIGIVIRRSNM